jgi:alkylation response protein AidB-like acyl-CoA dehydrogenase
MGRLAQTDGLTDVQQEILATVRTFVDKEILPVATELEHRDEYPADIVEGMKEMGLFGITIPEEYGGLGESLLTYALAVEEIARGWMSVSGIINTHFIVAYMLLQHGTEEQKKKYLPRMATGEVRGAFSMSEPGCGSDVSAIKRFSSSTGKLICTRKRSAIALTTCRLLRSHRRRTPARRVHRATRLHARSRRCRSVGRRPIAA